MRTLQITDELQQAAWEGSDVEVLRAIRSAITSQTDQPALDGLEKRASAQTAQGTGLPEVGDEVEIACEIADVGTVFQRARVSDHGFSVNEIEDSPGDPGSFGPFAVADEGKTWRRVQQAEPAQPSEPLYPCAKCGKMRTKAEGGTTFTTCEGPGINCDGTPESKASSEPAGEVTTRDMDALRFIRDRMEHVHGESPNVDYMLAASRAIANIARATAADRATIAELRNERDYYRAEHRKRFEECTKLRQQHEADAARIRELEKALDDLANVVGEALLVRTLDDGEGLSHPSEHAIVQAMLTTRMERDAARAELEKVKAKLDRRNHMLERCRQRLAARSPNLCGEIEHELATDHEHPAAADEEGGT